MVEQLKKMLDDNNVLLKSFRMVRDRYQIKPFDNFRLWLLNAKDTDGRQYNLPVASKIARLIISDMEAQDYQHDIIIEYNRHSL